MEYRKILNVVGREFNPMHDLDRINHMSMLRNYLWALTNMPKHMIRGGTYGAVFGASVGTLVGIIAGADAQDSTVLGSIFGTGIGSPVDCIQFIWRSAPRYIRLRDEY